MADAFRAVDVTRVKSGARAADRDRAATEEPLEIRLHGRPFAVIMRTPGADRELAAGFLLAERVLATPDDLGAIEHCRDARPAEAGTGPAEADVGPAKAGTGPAKAGHYQDEAHAENIINVTLANGSADAIERVLSARRQVTTNSSCGLCGRLTIESLRLDTQPLPCDWTMAGDALVSMPDRLRAAQAVFEATGGLHAAGLFTREGRLADLAEDVGRHNAVDKVIGRMVMRDALPLSSHVLFVSGRTSFEIVQKAFLAGIPVLGSVSAPSSLAIDLARETGITLVGFVRGDSFNIYSHLVRIT